MALKTVCAVLAALVAGAGAADAGVTYDLTLTPSGGGLYGGTGVMTLATAPAASGLTSYTPSQVSLLTFAIDGQSFSAPPGSLSAVQFQNGQVRDITFAQQIGASPNRYDLQTTGGYVFYYNNLLASSAGAITSALAPIPAPAPLAVFAAALLGALGRRRRRG